MFLVPTYLSESAIHGLGVFASFPLPTGTAIWRFDERVDFRLSEAEMESLPPRLLDRFRVYTYREPGGGHVFCGDHARFMNHADEPNCDDDGMTIRVNRPVAANTELTCDYRLFDLDAALGLEPYVTNRGAPTTRNPGRT